MFVSLYETPPRDHSDLKIRGSAYGTLSAIGCYPRGESNRGRAVQITEVCILDDDDLFERLTGMREWLENHRFNPSTYTYFFLDPGIKIHVAFKITGEAETFAQQFQGILVDTR